MTLRRLLARLRAPLRQRKFEAELQAEVEGHLELAERDAVARGMSPGEARRYALRSFGGVEQMKEEHREKRGLASVEIFWRDLCYGLAAVRRSPGFSAIVTGVLGLGIGANVAMFSVVDAVLLKPLPFRDPERIVRLWEAPRPGVTNATSAPDFVEWKRRGTGFEAMTAEIPVTVTLTGSGTATRLRGKAATADYFRVFDQAPLLGRTFAPDERNVVVLSHATWQTSFGADPGILGREVKLDGEANQVVGVLRAGAFDRDVDFVRPLVFTPEQLGLRENHWLTVHGRLRAEVTVAQAREQITALRNAMMNEIPFWKREWKVTLEPLTKVLVGDSLEKSLYIAFGAVALVLLIACANVTSLLLAKGAVRGREMGVRAALGASRARLVTQLLTESLVLCVLGGAVGLATGWALIRVADPLLKRSLPYTTMPEIDLRVFGFAAAVALVVSLLTGAWPALQTPVGNLARALRLGGRGVAGGQLALRRAIVIAEVALSLVLVCGGMLLFRSLEKLQRIETGVRTEDVITTTLSLPEKSYPTTGNAAAFYEAATARVSAIPGVKHAALSTHTPLRWIGNGEAIEVKGVTAPVNVRFKRVDAGYFPTMGIPVIAGRGITPGDRVGTKRVIVINEVLARRFTELTGIANPVGQRVALYCPRYIRKGTDTQDVEIAGVIRNERVSGPAAVTPPVVYVPLAQVPAQEVVVLVWTAGKSSDSAAGIRDAFRQVDPNLPLGEFTTMEEVRARTLAGASQPAWLIGGFASLAALLAAVGLYGVLAQTVTQQKRETGIRIALGARPRQVVARVLRGTLGLVGAGLVIGLGAAYATTRVLRTLLFEVTPSDPVSIAGACALMLLTGVVAGLGPAGRAARVDPVVALRDEG